MEQVVERLFTEEIFQEILSFYQLDSETKKLGDFENYVFEVKREGKPFVLRITHSSHRSLQELQAELDWIQYLHKHQISIPKGYEAPSGELVTSFNVEDSTFFATLFDKAPGQPVKVQDEQFNDNLFYHWGKIIGKMHTVTKQYKALENKRPSWNEEELIDLAKYLPEGHELVIERTKEVLDELLKLPISKDVYGLIHSDVHSGNFFWDGENIHVFDFDDSSYHWLVSDIAIPVYYASLYRYFLGTKEERTAFARKFFSAFLKGYKEEATVEDEWIAKIPLFMKLRDITLYSVLHKKIAPEDRDERLLQMMEEIKLRIEQNEDIVDRSLFL